METGSLLAWDAPEPWLIADDNRPTSEDPFVSESTYTWLVGLCRRVGGRSIACFGPASLAATDEDDALVDCLDPTIKGLAHNGETVGP